MGGRGAASSTGSMRESASSYIKSQASKLGRVDGPSTEPQRSFLKNLQSENEFKRGWGESSYWQTFQINGMSASEAREYTAQQQHVLSVKPESLSKNQASVAIDILQRKDLGIARTTTSSQRADNSDKWETRRMNADARKRINSRIDTLKSKLTSESSGSQKDTIRNQISSLKQRLKNISD